MGRLARLLGLSAEGEVNDYIEGPAHYHSEWPLETNEVQLSTGSVRLRPLRKSDGKRWSTLRVDDEAILRKVEPTVSGHWAAAHDGHSWATVFANLSFAAREGTVVPLAIEFNGEFVGQVTLGNIQSGPVSSCWIGYWLHHSVWGKGIATASVALGVDIAMRSIHMHRVEATVMESNPASRRVLENNGFRHEGILLKNLHIDGQWQDHHLMAITAEECPGGLVARQINRGRIKRIEG